MPRLTSATSINALLWAMPKYVRPPAPPAIAAANRADVMGYSFKGYLLTDADRAYLQEHGMPNGRPWRIDETPAPEGFVPC